MVHLQDVQCVGIRNMHGWNRVQRIWLCHCEVRWAPDIRNRNSTVLVYLSHSLLVDVVFSSHRGNDVGISCA